MDKRYKIRKHSWVSSDDKINENYYVLYEKKVWWKKEPIWKHCREYTYASYDSWGGERVTRGSIEAAEKYIKLQMIKDDGLEPEDIKIYECRNSKLEKILK